MGRNDKALSAGVTAEVSHSRIALVSLVFTQQPRTTVRSMATGRASPNFIAYGAYRSR